MPRSLSSALTALLCLTTLLLTACSGQENQAQQATPTTTSNSDLRAVQTYLQQKATTLKGYTSTLRQTSENYYTLAKGANFDYAALLQQKQANVTQIVQQARETWMQASPSYEQMEGIVAGQPELVKYDIILDAGVSGKEGGEDVVPFDLVLPNGKTLTKPGNLFGVTEGTLWGTNPDYTAPHVTIDLNHNGKKDFGDNLPEANVLKSASEALDRYAGELLTDAGKWVPDASDLFSALASNIPTVGDFFESWKTSRFVAGDTTAQTDFAVISRLSDIIDNVTSWQTMYKGISPMAHKADTTQDEQIIKGLASLKAYVNNLATQESKGKRFTPAEADLLSAEAQKRADAIAGQITQMAARLNIRITL
jgi:hypothetical protein